MAVCQDYFIWIYIVFWQGPFLKTGIDNLPVLSGTGLDSFYCICKCSKILNTFLFLFANKSLVFLAGIHVMLVRIATREDPDQTAS